MFKTRACFAVSTSDRCQPLWSPGHMHTQCLTCHIISDEGSGGGDYVVVFGGLCTRVLSWKAPARHRDRMRYECITNKVYYIIEKNVTDQISDYFLIQKPSYTARGRLIRRVCACVAVSSYQRSAFNSRPLQRVRSSQAGEYKFICVVNWSVI